MEVATMRSEHGRINQTSQTRVVEPSDIIAILQTAFEQAWEFVPPRRRTRASRDALGVAIVRLAARGNRDPGLLSTRALSTIIPEAPLDPL
jgi:hypothetical protein